MSKKSVTLIIFILAVTLGIISLYTTFAYNEETVKLENSTADYDLRNSLRDTKNQEVVVEAKSEKYVDISLNNTYNQTVKYGACYKLINPKNVPEGLIVTIAESSTHGAEEIIKPNEEKIISIKIVNNSEYNVDMLVGALIGFENGNIADLVSGEEILIK